MAKTLKKKTKGANDPSKNRNEYDSREDIVTKDKIEDTKKGQSQSCSKETQKAKSCSGDSFTHSIDEKFDDLERQVSETAKAVQEGVQKDSKSSEKIVQIAESELAKLKQDLNEAKDRGLRALAELENYRSRTNRVIAEDRKYAPVDLARAILPVWDNMGRAIEAAEQDFHPEAILDGLKMMYQQFLDIFRSEHIERISALHEPFNPHFHESIASFPNEEYPPNTVVHEAQAGFKLYDRVIRPTQVVLASPPTAASPSTPPSEVNPEV